MLRNLGDLIEVSEKKVITDNISCERPKVVNMLIIRPFTVEMLQGWQLALGRARYRISFRQTWPSIAYSLEVLFVLQSVQLRLYILQDLVTKLGVAMVCFLLFL